MLESIFTKLLILSVQAGFLILATIVIRGVFKKIPRKYICLLWCMAAIRLLLPTSIESDYSLVPTRNTIENVFSKEVSMGQQTQEKELLPEMAISTDTAYTITGDNMEEQKKEIYESFVHEISSAEQESSVTTVYEPVQPKKTMNLRLLTTYLWLFGMTLLLGYGIFTYLRVRRKVQDAVHQESNVWLSDRIDTPFLLGYIKPRIYMPFFVDESRREYIIAHENGHILRGDHITKLIGYILLSVYWFQPLVWVAYVLFCKDVEMACDEKVIGSLGEEKKKAYSQTLLLCSVEKHYLLANPLAFGEIDVKKRITNVLSYKKPGVIISMVSVLVLLILAALFMTNGKDVRLSDTTLTQAQQKYLATLADGTRYAIIPMKNSKEPLLLTTNDDWESPVFESDTDSISMHYYIFDNLGTFGATGTSSPVRWDEDGLYLGGEFFLSMVSVSKEVSPVTGLHYLEYSTFGIEDADYERVMRQYEKAMPVEFSYVVDNIPAENQILSDAQLLFLQKLEGGEQVAVLSLEGAEEPLLLAAEGVYKDPAFDNAEVSIIASYCILGQEGSMNSGGTAYPIRADYEAVYLESGHNITVLSIAEENGKKYLKENVYTENDENYPQVLEKCQQAPVVDFEIRLVELDSAITEQQKQLMEQLNAMEGMEAEHAAKKRAMAELVEQIKAEMDEMGAVLDNVEAAQKTQALFEEKYGASVQLGDCTSTEIAKQIAIRMFTEYMKMDNLYSTSLPGEYLGERYWQVDMEEISSAEDVYNHIRSLCSKEQADVVYNNLFGGEMPLLKEENGKLYTTAFDSIPIRYELYTDVILHSYDTKEIMYSICAANVEEEEEMTSFFVRCVKEGYNWVVTEYCPLMDVGTHEMFPDTVHSVVDMGEYQVVLQDYTVFSGGPLEVAILKDGKKETLSLLYEEWQRDPAKIRISKAEDVLGYNAFYVYDFGLVHTPITNYYTLVNGEIVPIAECWGYDPEEGNFSRDVDGDGSEELLCNLFYSGDGGQAVYVYKREGDKIVRGFLECDRFEESEDAIKVEISSFDGERDKVVIDEYKENSIETHYVELGMCNIAYYDYKP